ncbi:MAG: BACON domain-containing protein, partial [Alistipes sp.]|nr:BACON domain-containing protein [Alistipes sp.]
MKRLFYLIAILPLMLVGCENFGEENPTAPKLDDLFSEADLAKLDGFSAEGGQATLTFTPDLSWEASANRTWITVSPESGEAGEEIKLKVRLAENTSPNVRSGIVTVKLSDGSSFPIPVRQLGNENAELPNVVVDKSYHEIDSNGGELAVQISTNTEDYEVVIKESDKAWLSLTDTRAMQDKILVFTATKNESTQSREAKVTIYFGDEGSISFTIYQEGAQQQEEEPVLELVDGQNYEINPDGGDIDIKVLSNVAYAVEIPAEATWLHKAEPSRAATESIVTLYATKNDTGAKRSAEVKLTYADSTPVTFTVSQEPAEGGVTPPTPGATTIADVLAGELGDYTVEGAWVVATYARGCLLTDASGAHILAFNPSETPTVGEVINISGSVTSYGGLKQFAAGATVTKTGETKEVVHPTAEVMDGAALDAYLDAPIVKYVEYEGTLGISTNASGTTTYYNVTINGATAVGSVQYPTEEIKTQLSALD